ncbi:hypothetical protein WEH80_00425 [Actinomycetes bacterium KLBMP 9759]
MLSAAGGEVTVPWAEVGAAALTRLAAEVGLRTSSCYTGARAFAELAAP